MLRVILLNFNLCYLLFIFCLHSTPTSILILLIPPNCPIPTIIIFTLLNRNLLLLFQIIITKFAFQSFLILLRFIILQCFHFRFIRFSLVTGWFCVLVKWLSRELTSVFMVLRRSVIVCSIFVWIFYWRERVHRILAYEYALGFVFTFCYVVMFQLQTLP